MRGTHLSRTVVAALALAGLLFGPAALASTHLPAGLVSQGEGVVPFEAGAAEVDITPPPYTSASDQAFVPACGSSPAQVAKLWPGRRQFAFEDPYIPLISPQLGEYVVGDPYCDADHAGRYQAPYIAGPPGQDHWPTGVQPGNPLQAEAVVFALGDQRVAMVVIDSIGLFNVTMDQIRADVRRIVPQVGYVFVSSTHDESAPDPIGLWGPDGTGMTDVGAVQSVLTSNELASGVDNYYLSYLASRAATAVKLAYQDLQPARLRLAYSTLPPNVEECWSSYPFVADHEDPVMQATSFATGKAIFTLVNSNTHVESFADAGLPQSTRWYSADWAGYLRRDLEKRYGGVGIELSGLLGSVETPAVYPAGTQVVNVPGAYHDVPGPPTTCSTVYPDPSGAEVITNEYSFMSAYAGSVATAAETSLARAGRSVAVHRLVALHRRMCIQLGNSFFAAFFAAGFFPDRPAYTDPTCSVGFAPNEGVARVQDLPPGRVHTVLPWIETSVGVLSIGPAQFAYVPGEMFPVAAVRGHIDNSQMPFPTNCYDPVGSNFTCGQPFAMPPWLVADMTEPYKFFAGLGEDMLGYMMPPADFVGTQEAAETTPSGPGGLPPAETVNVPESLEQPWLLYETTNPEGEQGTDRFGYGHPDDDESVGPYAASEVESTLAGLLTELAHAGVGQAARVLPGLYVDADGRLSDSPFPDPNPYSAPGPNSSPAGFSGAVGVLVATPDGNRVAYCTAPALRGPCQGPQARRATGWATFDGVADPGTEGTPYRYSVSTAGVILASGGPLLVDVYKGASLLEGR